MSCIKSTLFVFIITLILTQALLNCVELLANASASPNSDDKYDWYIWK